MRRVISFFLSILVSIFAPYFVFGMDSTNFSIGWDTLNMSGSDSSTSTNYNVRDSVGELTVGSVTGSQFRNVAGYRGPQEASALSVDVQMWDSSTQSIYTAVDVLGKTVTLLMNTGYFQVGEFIAVVENEGFSQRVLVGKLTSVSGDGLTLTVDQFDGATNTISAVPNVEFDFVYSVDRSNISFSSTVYDGNDYTAVALASVQTTYGSGYSLYVSASSSLIGDSGQIADVTDFMVSSGEEYGACVTGTRAYGTDEDFAVTSTQRLIMSHNSATGPSYDRIAMIYKLSVASDTPAGDYSQIVYYTLTPNY